MPVAVGISSTDSDAQMSKAKIGEEIWKNRIDKVNAELFVMTYGSLVAQLVRDMPTYEDVNKQLDTM